MATPEGSGGGEDRPVGDQLMEWPVGYLDELRGLLPIASLICEDVELEMMGASLRGRCPLHPDPVDSLHVDETQQRFHCFSCGHGGDAIRWTMARWRLDEATAVARLAEKAGLPFPAWG